MKTMIKALSATLLFAAPLPAFAQGMPVHDSANLIQQINAVRQAVQVVAQGKAQIAEAQKLYQDLNKLTDIPRLATQLKSDISHSILEQVATKIMLPNPFGARRDYVEGFALSEAEFKLVREDLAPESHKFLVKQGHDSVVVELDLSGLDDALAVLSGRAETTAVADEIIAEVGADPALWLPLFHQRRRPS